MRIEELCQQYKVAKPTTFCWPFYSVNNKFQRVLSEKGCLFARGGHEQAYLPTMDNPFDAPSFTTVANTPPEAFAKAAKMATAGKVVIFTFHGVPDGEHPGITVEPARFEEMMSYLKDNQYTVIAMRELAKDVDPAKAAQFLSRPLSLPWGGRSPAWGGVTTKRSRLFLCVEKMPADRKLTVPSLTTRISQTLQFDKGNYAVSFDVVRRRGYSATSTPLSVTMDGATVFTLEATKITAAWAGCISPVFPVTACVHTLAFILGEGEGMDMIDNVALKYRK